LSRQKGESLSPEKKKAFISKISTQQSEYLNLEFLKKAAPKKEKREKLVKTPLESSPYKKGAAIRRREKIPPGGETSVSAGRGGIVYAELDCSRESVEEKKEKQRRKSTRGRFTAAPKGNLFILTMQGERKPEKKGGVDGEKYFKGTRTDDTKTGATGTGKKKLKKKALFHPKGRTKLSQNRKNTRGEINGGKKEVVSSAQGTKTGGILSLHGVGKGQVLPLKGKRSF